MNTERRISPRLLVKTRATVVCNNGLARLPALILDHSDTGVRVRLDEGFDIRGECYLLFEHRMEPCNLVWQTGRTAGLSFA